MQRLNLCGHVAVCLRDDFRSYLPELLPRFIGLFAEAERSGNYDQVHTISCTYVGLVDAVLVSYHPDALWHQFAEGAASNLEAQL